MSKVYLIGAGPGDADLITLKGIKAIENSDVILYDKLVNKDILKYAKAKSLKIFVGKENGYHSIEQDKINEIMLKYVKEGFIVSRLKSGDPFIFGRGAEEALFLKENNINYEIIPGVSSATALAVHAYIPLTYRELSSSFAVITGHKVDDNLNHIKWDKIAGIDTLVFLMAVSSRQEIARRLIENGRSADDPVAFVENGFFDDERIITTSLGDIIKTNIEIKSPAVMIIGEVVGLREKLRQKEILLCKS